MRKPFKKYLSISAITACLLLSLSGMNAYASGYASASSTGASGLGNMGGGGLTDLVPPAQSTSAAATGGYITSSGRSDGTTNQSNQHG